MEPERPYPKLPDSISMRCTCGGKVYEIDSKRHIGFCPGAREHQQGKLWQV